jgi:hypothetical protein
MATPHVSGAVALLKQKNPSWSPEEIKASLKGTTVDIGEEVIVQGSGRIDVLEEVGLEKSLVALLEPVDYFLSGVIDIYGTANGEGFENYSMFYKLVKSSEWIPICTGNNVVNDNRLCTFNTASIYDDSYQIKLIVYGTNGMNSQDFNTFIIDKVEILPFDVDFHEIGDDVNINLRILGNYESYSLEYRKKGDNEWGTIFDKILHTEELTEGNYDLRLTVSYSSDTVVEYETIYLASFNDESWFIDFGSEYVLGYNSVLVEDLNGDNKKEIILSGYNTQTDSCSIIIVNSDGSYDQQINIPVQGGIFASRDWSCNKPLSIADLDSNGYKELIISVRPGFDSNNFGKDEIYVYDWEGNLFENWPKVLPGASNSNYPFSIGDVDNDGYLDIITFSGGASCSACADHGEFYVLDYEGNVLPGWPFILDSNKFFRSPVLVTNLNEDQFPELVVTVFNGESPNQNDHFTFAFDKNGNIIDNFPYTLPNNQWGWTHSSGDINNDGLNEIFTQTGPISNTAQTLPWSDSSTYVYSPIAIGNVNNNEYLEIVYGNGDCKLNLKTYLGDSFPGWPIHELDPEGDPYCADGTSIIADFSGGNSPEIITIWKDITWFGTFNPNKVWKETGLHAYNIDGSLVEGFPIFEGFLNPYSITVVDIDEDSRSELIWLGKGKSGKYYLFASDYPKTGSNSPKYEWPMFQRDAQHTGCYDCGEETSSSGGGGSKPQSKIVNNENFDLNGTLSLILQRKIGDKWRHVEIVTNEEVSVSANSLIKLDVGEPYGWNLKNVFANQPGKYRVYGSFEVGEKKVETAWEFDVLGAED